MRETYNSKDFREGVNAFLEGRSPSGLVNKLSAALKQSLSLN